MDGQIVNTAQWIHSRTLWSVVLAAPLWACPFAMAAEESLPTPPQSNAPQSTKCEPGAPQATTPQAPPFSGMRYGGGVFEESYFRNLQRPMQSQIQMGRIPTATGGYNYGFPMQTYRWGYFGAQPENPRTTWHRGYYSGEKSRVTYRYGY